MGTSQSSSNTEITIKPLIEFARHEIHILPISLIYQQCNNTIHLKFNNVKHLDNFLGITGLPLLGEYQQNDAELVISKFAWNILCGIDNFYEKYKVNKLTNNQITPLCCHHLISYLEFLNQREEHRYKRTLQNYIKQKNLSEDDLYNLLEKNVCNFSEEIMNKPVALYYFNTRMYIDYDFLLQHALRSILKRPSLAELNLESLAAYELQYFDTLFPHPASADISISLSMVKPAYEVILEYEKIILDLSDTFTRRNTLTPL